MTLQAVNSNEQPCSFQLFLWKQRTFACTLGKYVHKCLTWDVREAAAFFWCHPHTFMVCSPLGRVEVELCWHSHPKHITRADHFERPSHQSRHDTHLNTVPILFKHPSSTGFLRHELWTELYLFTIASAPLSVSSHVLECADLSEKAQH